MCCCRAFCRLMTRKEKIIHFVREWFLPIAMATGVLIFLLFHNLSFLDPIAEWYAPHNNDVLPFCMFLVLFTTFCKVDFKKLLPVVWHLWMLGIQLVLVVLLVWVVNTLKVGGQGLILLESIIVCVICPCGSATAVVTSQLGGSLEETSSYTFLSNIFSALLISLFFPLLPRTGSTGVEISFLPLFLKILWRVSLVLLVPMLVGFVIQHYLPRLNRVILSVPDLSFILWGISLTIVTATMTKNISDSLATTPLHLLLTIAAISLVVCLMQFALGRFVGRHMGKAIDCGQVLGQKNTIISIWVTTIFLHPLASLGPGCYILWQNLVNSVELYMEEKKKR